MKNANKKKTNGIWIRWSSFQFIYPIVLALNQENTMIGCALSLTNVLPPSHLSIHIKFKSFAFSIAATHSLIPTPKPSLLLSINHSKSNSHFSFSVAAQQPQQVQPGEEENIQLVSAIKTDYNDILIVDTPKARMLLLDSSCTPLTFSQSELLLKIQTLLHGSSGSQKYSNAVLHFLIYKCLYFFLSVISLLQQCAKGNWRVRICVSFVADSVHSLLYHGSKWTCSYWVCMLPWHCLFCCMRVCLRHTSKG